MSDLENKITEENTNRFGKEDIGREVEIASDRFLARERMAIFLGSAMPQTIAMKEIIDNEIDVVSERGQKANKAIIMIGPNRLRVMDNGTGISTEIKEGDDKPSIWYACAKMFTSSNYSDNAIDSIGANGVGLTLANYTSKKFTILNFNGRSVKGYSFTDGYLNGTPESGIEETGDYVNNPMSFKTAIEKFNPPFERGFFVDVTWYETPNELFSDKANIDWLIDYTRFRVGEINSGEIELYHYDDNDFTVLKQHYIWNKDSNSEYYVKSWEEKVKEHKALILKEGPWQIAFSTDPNMKIESVCQGAPIRSRYATTCYIKIQDEDIGVNVPFTMKYLSKEYPPYTDQTKVALRFPYGVVERCFERSGDIYKYFYREAEIKYMDKVIRDSDTSMFWPSLGPAEESELIIAEGFSAISGLKSQRDPKTQACIALKGKILNCWNLDIVKAMRSDVVKQILNAVLYNKYKRVIIAADADEDGNHIASLLISLFARFTHLIQEGKLYYVHTPRYIFKKGKDFKWSDKASDCPSGYHITTLKGLGSMQPNEVRTFIMDENTRTLIKITEDEHMEDALNNAFTEGGKRWIIDEEAV